MQTKTQSYMTLEPLFQPRSVAVIGASANPHKIGSIQLKMLIDGGFAGNIYPINAKANELQGHICYPSLQEVPGDVDTAILCVGADQVLGSLRECGEKGVKAAVVFASGFSEIGEEGKKQQIEIAEVAKKYGIRMIGPNCVGIVNTMNGFFGTFSPAIQSVPMNDQKSVGYISQSGAFGVLTYMAAAQHGLTFNYFVSVGNEMETEFSDVVEYMVHDDQTKVISGYLEGAKNPDKLRTVAKEALSKNKPIVLMKTGRSSAGSRAASSHTGSLAGSDRIYDAFLKQTGIIRVDDYEDILSFSKLFLSGKLPKGRNTVLITSSGGRGINEADRCEANGLNIIELKEETVKEIKKAIPYYASASNPIDLTAAASVSNPELFTAPIKALLADDEVHNIIFTEFPLQWSEETSYVQELIEMCSKSDKFVAVTTFPLEGMSVPKATAILEKNGIPVIPGNLNPIKSLARLVDYSEQYRKHLKEKEGPEEAATIYTAGEGRLEMEGKGSISESAATNLLESYRIPVTRRAVAQTEEEAIRAAEEIGYPVVLKINSPDILHKSDANALALNLQSPEEVRKAFASVHENAKKANPDADLQGALIQEMLPQGVEVIIGSTNDPVFGPVIMFGLGGIYVEVFKDVAFRIAPLTRKDAYNMIDEVKGKAILDGVRGKGAVDKEAVVDALLNISRLVMDHKESIAELDLNPLIVYEKGAKAADAAIVLKRNQ
ncbi:acetate--CoA ligase family protein [Bacillus testis]|uniref:acetate--CoA ligase family protein n=1 Tax=Bacillus testis TaxID=1622072 RepID=UPI00067EA1B5|nr:acetate--CoA ligase family protein [Bacillus testis]